MYSICYWEVCIHLSAEEGRTNFLLKEFCAGRIFHGEGNIQRVNFSGEIFTVGEFTRIPYRIFFICLFFS